MLGQWVVLTKTINLLPRGGVIALTTCLILGNRRKLVWETQREIIRRSSLNHWCSSWKKSKGCITLGRKVYSSAIIGGIGTTDCTLSVTHGADSAAEGCGVACRGQRGHHCFGKQGWSKQQTTAIWCAWKVCYLNIVLTIKSWHSFIQGTPPSEFLQTRPDSPILFDPHYLCCYLCCVVADTFASLEWQHQNHYLCSSRKSFSLVAILIRKRLKEWKEQNLDLPVSQSLPQVPGFPFSGVQSPSLHLSLKAPSPWAGCKALELLLFQSHGLQQQHSILHIKVLACCVWTHSQAPWLEKQTFSTQWLFQFLLP